MRNQWLKQAIITAEFAVFIAIFSQFSIPLGPIPLTGQTFAVGLTATILKPKDAFQAVFIYLLMGVIGLPVFAEFHSGISVLFGATGGFLVGFLANAYVTSYLIQKTKASFFWGIFANIVGALFTLVFGTIWIKLNLQLTWISAFQTAFFPFLLPGILKAVFAGYIGIILHRRLSVAIRG